MIFLHKPADIRQVRAVIRNYLDAPARKSISPSAIPARPGISQNT